MRALPAAIATLLVPVLAGAHHSPAAYDQQAVVTIVGTLVDYDWMNPHVYLTVRDTTGGSERLWQVEAFPPSTLKAMGWSRDALAVGDRVTLTANPARNREHSSASLLTLEKGGAVLYDGTKVFTGGERPAAAPRSGGNSAPTSRDQLAGVWATVAEPVLGQFFSPAPPLPVTPKGAAAIRAFTDLENPGKDCIPFSAPAYMLLPGFKKIELRTDTVLIRGELDDVERVVHLGLRTHDGAAPSVQGHSIGSWEGTTLVVDTARFAEHRLGLAGGLPSSAGKHLVERFEPGAGGQTLTYRFTVEDPEYLTQPVEGTLHWQARPDVDFTPMHCDLDVARRFLKE
jgi:hypothetical protein